MCQVCGDYKVMTTSMRVNRKVVEICFTCIDNKNFLRKWEKVKAFCDKLEFDIDFDNEGQVIIYTGLTAPSNFEEVSA